MLQLLILTNLPLLSAAGAEPISERHCRAMHTVCVETQVTTCQQQPMSEAIRGVEQKQGHTTWCTQSSMSARALAPSVQEDCLLWPVATRKHQLAGVGDGLNFGIWECLQQPQLQPREETEATWHSIH